MKLTITFILTVLSYTTFGQWTKLTTFDSSRIFYTAVSDNKIVNLPRFTNSTNRVYYISYNNGIDFEAFEFSDTSFLTFSGGLHFPDSNIGYATLQEGAFMKTTDGGLTWSKHYIPEESNSLEGVQFFTPQKGLFATRYQLYSTNDGGLTFTGIPIPTGTFGKTNFITSFSFIDELNGSITTTHYDDADSIWENAIYTTTNGGTNWEHTYYNTKVRVNSWDYKKISKVQMLDHNLGFAMGGDGIFLKTTNGGTSWAEVNPEFSSSVTNFAFLNEQVGIAINNYLEVLKTIDGGLTWVPQIIESSMPLEMQPQPMSLTIANDSTIYLPALTPTFFSESSLYKFIYPLELGIESIKSLQLNIYPNPTSDMIHIDYAGDLNIQSIQLTDVSGKLIKTFINNFKQLNIKGVASGSYFLTVAAKEGVISKKIIVNK